jgi:hypothetical protein
MRISTQDDHNSQEKVKESETTEKIPQQHNTILKEKDLQHGTNKVDCSNSIRRGGRKRKGKEEVSWLQ